MIRALSGFLRLLAVLAIFVAQTAQSQSWQLTDGAARDVGVGADGSVWVIGAGAVGGGYGIYRRVNNTWVNIPGGAERIAVDPQGNAWVVNNSNNIFRYDGTKWVLVNGTARDIGVGANGTVWVIGVAAEAGGHVIYRTTDQGANWTKIPGAAVRISVDPQGNAWVVNNTNNIFRFNGSTWVMQPGSATDVGIGADGAAWVIGADGGIYRWENSNWAKKTGGAAQIAAGPNGLVWVVNQGNQIYQAQVAAPASTQVASSATLIPATPTVVTVAPTPAAPIVMQGSINVIGGPGTAPATPAALYTSGYSYAIGPEGVSKATCGVWGTGLCSAKPASFANNASIECPSGTFPDLGRSACYSCPENFTRSIHAVDNYKACQRPDATVVGSFMTASYKGPLCAEGSFHDPIRGGECYRCPDGYIRSAAHIDATNACYIPIKEIFSAVTHHKSTIWPHECGAGTFWDGYNGGNCYSCPGGYRRTAYSVSDGRACAQTVGEQQAKSTLVKKAECGPGEISDPMIQGTQNLARGGGCWACPVGTDRTILSVAAANACERAAGVQWANATRARPMTCEASEIFDLINSNDPNVSSALAARNALFPGSPIQAASAGGSCWTCPSGEMRTADPVYSGSACKSPGIIWKSAPYNQPGLFGLHGAEAVALKLVTERTLINSIIQDLKATGKAPANFEQAAWDEIGTQPQNSAVLAIAVFSRVVAAANNLAAATPDERVLLGEVIQQITRFRVFMAQDALDAYRAWKGGGPYRDGMYKQSQLQVSRKWIDEAPPDFGEITAATILGSLGAAAATNTAVYLTMTSNQIFGALYPGAVRLAQSNVPWAASALFRQAASIPQEMSKYGFLLDTRKYTMLQAAARQIAQKAASASLTSSGALMSIGPQIIINLAVEILIVMIEHLVDVADAEPKLLAGLATATAYRADFPRLMSTAEGSAEAQSHWTMLLSGPAARADGTRPAAIGPANLPAFTQQAVAAKQAVVALAR